MSEQDISLPAEFKSLVEPVIGDKWDAFAAALSENPSVSIRFNDKMQPVTQRPSVPWCPDGRYLTERPQFTLDPLLHAGAYYVQEASSMFLYRALNQYVASDSVVLDLCAAPGGKSTLINRYLSDKGFLVSNEYMPQRAHILVENMAKWGCPNTVITNNAPQHFEVLPHLFDAVCVDAPCSGEGMFRKDSNAIAEWSRENVDKCVTRQREILTSAWETLKPGGILVYSTCTYNKLENEENIKWLTEEFGAEYLLLNVEPEWNITETDYGYRFMPHKTRGEGLFLAVLRKPETESVHRGKYKLPKQLPERCDKLLNYVKHSGDYKTILHKTIFYAVQKHRYELTLQLIEKLNVLSFGIPLAEPKGKDYILHPSLALSKELNCGSVHAVELSYSQAIAFLRTETLYMPDAPRGILLVTYRSLPLGWVKNVGNRCNNLYPTPWRIRMQSDVAVQAPEIL